MMNGMPVNLFWIVPLLCMGFVVVMRLLRSRDSRTRQSIPEKETQPSVEKTPSAQIPEELKKAGQQVLENLDWEIRLLEKQLLDVKDRKERQQIEKNLKRKKEEHKTTVERLG